MGTYLEQSLAKLKEFEVVVPWMYRDTVGRVTVGVGLMLPAASAAQGLPFSWDGRPATSGEIAADFKRVMLLPAARLPEFYRCESSPELAQETIDARLLAVLTDFDGQVRARLKCYDTLPDDVKLALLDMAYTLGPAGLFREYPKMIKAVETGAWAQAAAKSVRYGPGPERNTWTRAMFLSGAVVDSIRAEAEGWWKRMWRRVQSLWR